MKSTFTLVLIFFVASIAISQNTYDYVPSEKHPYGLPNPKAPAQIKDFEPMIGKYKCLSATIKSDGTWTENVDMIWSFKYIMNGMAIQDETLQTTGAHSGSIRQYISDSSRWYVHFYSSTAPSTTLSTWEGNREEGKIVLYQEQAAPNGTEGYYRLTFSDFVQDGYKWVGEWVDKTESVVFPTWRIKCLGKL